MADEHAYDGSPIATVRVGTVELREMADAGQEGVAHLVLDDASGSTEIIGQKSWESTEADCANPLTWSGFVLDTETARDAGLDRGSRAGVARRIAVTLVDINNYLSHDGITEGGKRPAETCQERFDWITGSDFWPADVAVGSRVDIPAKGMDAADYTDQSPGDVVADIAIAAGGLQFYVADWGDGPEITLRDDNASTDDSSAVRISTAIADRDSDHTTLGATKTFAPSTDFTLKRTWREVYSKMAFQYSKGRRVAERAATAAAHNGTRFGTASNSQVKTAAKADDALTDLLWTHHTPRDELTGSILVPKSAVNLLRKGERCQVKIQHLGNTGAQDYDSFTWCRVLERTVSPKVGGSIYGMDLRLAPQEAGPAVGAVLQRAFGTTWEGGGTFSFPSPVTVGSKLVYICVDRDGNGGAPNTTPTDDNWGTDAWTELSLQDIDATGTPDTIRAFWKVADATNQDCWIEDSRVSGLCWELPSTADVASATLFDVELQTATPYLIDTVGDTDSGDVILAGWGVYDEPSAPRSRSYGTGFTERYAAPSYTTFYTHHPWAYFADATGAHTGLVATMSTGVSKQYAGIALRIPSA